MRKVFFLFTIFFFLLAACGTQATPAPSAPASGGAAKAIENYLTTLTGKKLDAVKNASCAAWERDAKIDFDSFQAVTAKLDGMACQDAGKDGNFTLVNCKGKILVTYQNENQTLNLADKNYLAVQEGEWKMCGYK
ncbi:MAG: hypothetical protein HZB77_15935 [Chloroflexi bacterium]|nr:hypothetical protein [Chloroflexota bacterium]